MKAVLFFLLFTQISCALRPERNFASAEPILIAEIDPKHSLVRLFTSDSSNMDLHYFYFELRNKNNQLVDTELKDIVVKDSHKVLRTYPRRISLGRYEVKVEKELADLSHLRFLIQKKKLAHKLVNLRKPAKKHTEIVLLSNINNELIFRLSLRDGHKRALEMTQAPELLLDGLGEMSDLKMVKNGVWEFVVTYPEHNQILYLSVRANGILLERLFRFQHVEK